MTTLCLQDYEPSAALSPFAPRQSNGMAHPRIVPPCDRARDFSFVMCALTPPNPTRTFGAASDAPRFSTAVEENPALLAASESRGE